MHKIRCRYCGALYALIDNRAHYVGGGYSHGYLYGRPDLKNHRDWMREYMREYRAGRRRRSKEGSDE